MDALTCRSPARCASCEHFTGAACALEEALDAALAVMERAERRRARVPVRAARAPLATA